MWTPVLVVAAGLAALAAPPQRAADPLGEAYFQFLQARQLESAGDVDGAVRALRRAIALAPAAAEIRAELAGVFAREGLADEALVEARAALAIEPGSHEAHRIAGLVQAAMADAAATPTLRAERETDAVTHLEQALAGGARDPAAELTLGRLYVRTARHAAAIGTLTRFLTQQPGYPEAVLLLVDALTAEGRTADAIDAVETQLGAPPDDLRARVTLAELYEDAGRWLDAAGLWGLVGRASLRSTPYRVRQGAALVNAGELAAGRDVLAGVTRDAPRDLGAWYLLAEVERRSGNPDAVERAARQIAELSPGDPRGVHAAAWARIARRDFSGAVDLLEPRVRAPQEADVASGLFTRMAGDLAEALQGRGEAARAVAVLEEAGRRAPDSSALAYSLAAAYERAARYAEAERGFRAIIAADPRHDAALNYLGYMLADRGEKLDEAVGLIERALALAPGHPSYLDSLGWAFFRQARFDEARGPLERAAAALPRSSVVQDHLAALYFQLKRYREAADTWDRALDGDREGVDVADLTRKRNRARELAGK